MTENKIQIQNCFLFGWMGKFMIHDLMAMPDPRPVCIGSGFVALDLIINENSKTKPKFYLGGSCGNVLTILSYLGWKSYPICRLGDDITAKRILQDMNAWQINTDFIELDPKV